jgi:hypothetical protein
MMELPRRGRSCYLNSLVWSYTVEYSFVYFPRFLLEGRGFKGDIVPLWDIIFPQESWKKTFKVSEKY